MAKKETTKKAVTSSKKASSKTSKKTSVKATSKSTPKTSVKTRTPVQSHAVKSSKKKEAVAVDDSTKTTEHVKRKSFQFRKPYLFFALGIVLLGALLYLGRGLFVAAVVNGQPISRIAVVKEAEKQSGRQALDIIVRNTLIEQEARKANISVSNQEIDDEIKRIEDTLSKQGQKLDDILVMQGLTREDVRTDLRLNLLVNKIVGKDVEVTDKEIDDYINTNRELLPQDQSEEELRKVASEQLKQQKLNEKVSTWFESLQTKAKVMYFVQY